jgi:phosphoribosyl 1,2-cyclic phosphate phosphodiesterase
MIFVSGKCFLIDVSSDFRAQMLAHRIRRIDSILMTHHHFDHIGGIDDLRQFNFIQQVPMRMFGSRRTLDEISSVFRYAFAPLEQVGGGVPTIELNEITAGVPCAIEGVEFLPVQVMHGIMPILGYRVGGFAYITDTNQIPDESFEMLKDLDVLVLDALRLKEHPTHFSLDQAVDTARKIAARQTYFTHIAHDIKYENVSAKLPEGMHLAYDGLRISLLSRSSQ